MGKTKRVRKPVYKGPKGRPCSVKGCKRTVEARDLCGKCYEWMRAHGAVPVEITPLGRVSA